MKNLNDYIVQENLKPMSQEDVKTLRELYMGKTIKIIHIDDKASADYDGKSGEVTHINDKGYIHGTWGGLSLIPGLDNFVVIN